MNFFVPHIIGLSLLILGCGAEAENNSVTDMGTTDMGNYPQVSFEKKIVPILRNSCLLSGCHGMKGNGAFRVDSGIEASAAEIQKALEKVKSNGGNLLVNPGKPGSSQIVIRVFAEMNGMPPLDPLPAQQKNDLNFWIAQGAKY